MTAFAPDVPAAATAAALFAAEPWRKAVEDAFDVSIRPFVPPSEPDAVGWYSVLSDLRGERVVSTPFSDFCDPTITTAEGWNEFADYLRSHRRPVTIRPFAHAIALADTSFERRGGLVWHGVDLSEGAERVWDGLSSKLRTSIRRAPKAGIRFRASSTMDDLATFHSLHVELRRSKYRMLAQPLHLFESLHQRFGDDLVVLLAEDDDGTPVAGMVYLAWEGVWSYKFSASVPRNGYRPNAALLMEACRLGADRGLRLLDMGRSDTDQPGLVSFKQQFASEERDLSTLHWTPPGWSDPGAEQAGRTLGQLTTLLTDPEVPSRVAVEASRLLYRNFG